MYVCIHYCHTSSLSKSEDCVKVTQSCLTLCNPMDYIYSLWNSPGRNTGVGSLSLLQGIFPTQKLKPGLPPCRQILYQLSHKGSPGILDWVSYPFSRGPSQPRNRTRVSWVAGGFFTSWAFREAPNAHCEDCVGWYYSFILFSSHFYSQVEQFFNCLLSIWMS